MLHPFRKVCLFSVVGNISLEMVTVSSSPRPTSLDSSVNVNTDTEYLQIAKKGGGHKGKTEYTIVMATCMSYNIKPSMHITIISKQIVFLYRLCYIGK